MHDFEILYFNGELHMSIESEDRFAVMKVFDADGNLLVNDLIRISNKLSIHEFPLLSGHYQVYIEGEKGILKSQLIVP